MDCLFLYNPASGKGKLAKKLPAIESKLKTRYDRVEICAPQSAQDLERRVREAECDVFFSGGDGTFNRVLQAAAGREIRLGYLPSGTVNDVARSLKIPLRAEKALDAILAGEARAFDCLRINRSAYAMYIAAAGAFTETTYDTPQSQKRRLGALAYALNGLKRPLRVFPVKVECGGETVEADCALVFALNGRSVAGFPVNRKGSMRDGAFEIALVRRAKKPNLLQRLGAYCLIGSLFLFGVRVKRRDVLFLRGSRARIETEGSLVWDLDGEKGPRGDVEIELLPRAVNLFVPKRTAHSSDPYSS